MRGGYSLFPRFLYHSFHPCLPSRSRSPRSRKLVDERREWSEERWWKKQGGEGEKGREKGWISICGRSKTESKWGGLLWRHQRTVRKKSFFIFFWNFFLAAQRIHLSLFSSSYCLLNRSARPLKGSRRPRTREMIFRFSREERFRATFYDIFCGYCRWREIFFFKRKTKFKVLVAFERFSMECKESMWNELNIVELRGEIVKVRYSCTWFH